MDLKHVISFRGESSLGCIGQAAVPGVAGTWKDLTDNVNLMAGNLTTQVRAIADVATAVTKGDLTRSIQVDARGEVAELKDNINAMIQNLRATTDQNTEQDWLKTNLAKFTRMLQGQRDLMTVGQMLLSELAPLVSAQYGAIYRMDSSEGDSHLKMLAGYALPTNGHQQAELPLGVGLVGQCAIEKRRILLQEVPNDYVRISSGLGEAGPRSLIVLPVLFEGDTKAVVELASLAEFTSTHLTFLSQLTESIGIVLNSIEATMRTEGLLQQSQKLATELQAQQKELQQTNEELGNKAQQLAEQNAEVERKNREIEQARHAVEEKAAELALASKYKSEFLANMSHELRTPLNSVLILAQQLADNPEGNLKPKQVEFSKSIHAAGADLMNLISDILDLSKIESGTVTVEPEEVSFARLRDAVERSFRHVAETKHLAFDIELDPELPRSMNTDVKQLQQVLKNLLSNAFKFTAHGRVSFRVGLASSGWSFEHVLLNRASRVIAFEVRDTGIGIAPDKQRIIFEAFHQADAGTKPALRRHRPGSSHQPGTGDLAGGRNSLEQYAERRQLTEEDEIRLVRLAESVVLKGVQSPERLLDETALFLHLLASELPPNKQEMLERLRQSDEALWGKKVLVVDDDVRNIFALTSLLEQHGMQVVSTETGTEAISLLDQNDDIDAVLMDIMMPEMNLMQKNLEAEGHRVLMARDGPEAVQTYIRHKQEINLVVLDLGLPKLNGWEAYKMMKEADPNVKVIFATGFISPEIEAHLSTGELSAVITKPYTPTEMRKKIASGLHKPASSPALTSTVDENS